MKAQALFCSLAMTAFLAGFAAAKDNSDSNSDRSDRSSSRDSSASRSDSDRDHRTNRASNDDDRSSDSRQKHAGLGVTLSEDSQGEVWITFVAPGSPAQRAGLRSGDQLLKLDGDRVRSAEDVIDDIRDKDPGSKVALKIRRNGRTQDLDAKLVSREASFEGVRERISGYGDPTDERTGRRDEYGTNSSGRRSESETHGSTSMRSGGLEATVQQLQRQVAQLQREVQELRRERGSNVNRATYEDRREAPAVAPSDGNFSSGDSTSGENNSQDRNVR